jgi:hypothetical protein
LTALLVSAAPTLRAGRLTGRVFDENCLGSLNLAPYSATKRSPLAYGSGASITAFTTV